MQKNKMLKKLFISLFLVFLLVTMIYNGDIAESSESTILTGDGVIALHTSRVIGRQSNGTLVIGLRDNTNKLSIYNSEDEGDTWSLLFISGLAASVPSLCVDTDDIIHVACIIPSTGLGYVNSTDWDLYVIDNEAGCNFPSMALDSNDKIHIVYEKPTEGASNDVQVAYINSSDSGLTWSAIQVLTNEVDWGDDVWSPSIIINASNTLHVFYECEDYANGFNQIFHIYSIDSGISWTSWESDVITDDNVRNQYLGCAIIGSDDSIHLVWYNFSDPGSLSYTYNDSSGWSNRKNITDYTGNQTFRPSISYSANDDFLHVACILGEYYDNVTYVYNDTNSWQPHVNLTDWADPYHVNLIYAKYPNNTNIPSKGYCFVYENGTSGINFYKSDDLSFIYTNVDTIIPYDQTATPLTVTATNYSSVDNVTLWYRYSDDNITWGDDGGAGSINWWDESGDGTDWPYRKLITVDSGQIDDSLTNFPILINISGDNDLASHSQSDKDDLVFILYSDNTTVLNHEIENNGTDFVDAWVNVTSLSDTTDTLIWLYYGNLTCGSQENAIDVWDSDYLGVWHLHSDIMDSTVYDYDGTADGGIANAAGITGDGEYFDGDCHIDTDRDPGFGADAFTCEAWYKGTENSPWKAIMGSVDGSNGWAMINNAGSFNNWVEGSSTAAGVINNNAWHYCVMTRDLGTDGSMYLDSIYKADTVATTDVDSPTTFEIGGWGNDAYEGIGTLDEIRLSDIQRSGAWITTTFNTITNVTTFTTNDSEEVYTAGGGGGAGCDWQIWDHASNPDTSYTWSWNFNFPNGTGYYEFYSIGRIQGLNNETAPDNADALCQYVFADQYPFMNNPFPVNNSFGQPLDLIWNITMHDNDSLMNYTIHTSNGDSTAENNTGNGSKNIGIGGLVYYVKYTVWVNITDTVNNSMIVREFFYFTTLNSTVFVNNVSIASFEYPSNGSTDICLMVTCNVTISDHDGNVSVCNFYRSMNGIDWAWKQTNSSVLNTSIQFNYTLSNQNNTLYYWMVTCDDGNSNVSYWYSFTTVNALISITVIEIDTAQLGIFISLLLFMFFFWIGYTSPKRSGGGFMILASLILISLEALLIPYLNAIFVIPLISPIAIFILLLGIRKQFYPIEEEKTVSD